MIAASNKTRHCAGITHHSVAVSIPRNASIKLVPAVAEKNPGATRPRDRQRARLNTFDPDNIHDTMYGGAGRECESQNLPIKYQMNNGYYIWIVTPE